MPEAFNGLDEFLTNINFSIESYAQALTNLQMLSTINGVRHVVLCDDVV